jgi:GTP-binding protein
VAVLVVDAVEGLTAQDAHVAGYVVEEGKGLVVAVNKWDLVADKTDKTFDQYVEWIRGDAPFLDFAPVLSISAKTGQRVGRVLETAVDIWGERRRRIPTGELNRVLGRALRDKEPRTAGGKRLRILYVAQTGVAPPTFNLVANGADRLHFSEERRVENLIRGMADFTGSPIRVKVRSRTGSERREQRGNRRGASKVQGAKSKGAHSKSPGGSRKATGGKAKAAGSTRRGKRGRKPGRSR